MLYEMYTSPKNLEISKNIDKNMILSKFILFSQLMSYAFCVVNQFKQIKVAIKNQIHNKRKENQVINWHLSFFRSWVAITVAQLFRFAIVNLSFLFSSYVNLRCFLPVWISMLFGRQSRKTGFVWFYKLWWLYMCQFCMHIYNSTRDEISYACRSTPSFTWEPFLHKLTRHHLTL